MASSLGDFGKLPVELRHEIFLLIVQERVHNIEPFPVLPLSQVSKEMRWEVLPLFHGKGQFQHMIEAGDIHDEKEASPWQKKSEAAQARIKSHGVSSPILHNVEIICRTRWICDWEMSLTIQRKKGKQIVRFPARTAANGKAMKLLLNDDADAMSRAGWHVIRLNTDRREGVSLEDIVGMSTSMLDGMREGGLGD